MPLQVSLLIMLLSGGSGVGGVIGSMTAANPIEGRVAKVEEQMTQYAELKVRLEIAQVRLDESKNAVDKLYRNQILLCATVRHLDDTLECER